jgi:hypothetical protein
LATIRWEAGVRVAVAVAALLLLGGPAAASAAGPAGDWSIVASPNSSYTRTNNFLTATTCVSASDCWAVGYYNSTVSTYQTLIEHWDGTAWSLAPSPNTAVTDVNVLRGVTCVTASDCWAVGSSSELGSPQRTLILHWDGTSWAIAASPNSAETDYNYLFGVACAAASDCLAVGYHSAGQGFQTLAQHWNGTSWSIVASPNASGTQQSFLEGVACVAASDCWAVGWSVNAATGFNQTFVQRWTGTVGSIVSSPNALLTTHNDLHGVSCGSASDCWAVGSSSNGNARQSLTLRWSGASWAVVSSPSTLATEDNTLRAVACASASECWAIGTYTVDAARTLIERWNGSAWSIVASPNSSATQDNTLLGVGCAPAAAGCWAAGFYNDDGIQQSLAERWNGSAWVIVASADYTAPQNNTLLGVDCVSPTECWAVGSYFDAGVQQTLIERWNGNAWAVHPSPNTSADQSNILYDVSCATASDCWIVGYCLGDTAWQTLTLHWDGAAWAIVASPSVAGGNNFLTDVACVTASDCWAVGFYDTGVYQTLVLHWDGAAWAIVASPNTDLASENRLSGVNCVSASDCWAVGFHKIEGFLQQTLTEHWDGSAWSIVASPNTGAPQNNWFEDVACASASECWAVGAYSPAALGTGQPLIQRWDGAAWTIVGSPQPSVNNNNYLRGVTCAAASDCWAVGDYFLDGHTRSLIEHWDGSAWGVVASPNTGAAQNNRLVGVTCTSASDCWSVGYFTDDAGIFHTLTQRYVAATVPEPTAFTFMARTGVATNVFVTSESKTLAGFTGLLPIAIDNGGQYRIDSGAWTGAAGQVAAGSTLSVRHVSASAADTAKVSTVTVGAYSTPFKSVTSSLDRTPEAFGFGTKTGVEPGVLVESDAVTLTGFNTGISIAPGSGIAYRIDDGAWTTATGTLQPGQKLQVRHTSSTTALGYTKTYLKVGGVVGYFTTRTQ